MPATTIASTPAAAAIPGPGGVVAVPARGGIASRFATPTLAMFLGIFLLAAGIISASIGYRALEGIGSAIHTISHETAPSVVLALHARSDIAAMDAEATNDALVGNGSAVGVSAAFQADMDHARKDLEAAAENVTFGDSERIPLLETMHYALDMYPGALGEIRGISASADPRLLHSRTLWASRILSGWALPAAEQLERANLDPLNTSYNNFMTRGGTATVEVFLALGLLTIAIGAAQVFAFRNLGGTAVTAASLASTALVLLALVWVPWDIAAGRSAIYRAKNEAFDSVLSINETKAVLDHMNSLESMWLLVSPQEGRSELAAQFNGLAAQMLTVVPGQTPAVINQQLEESKQLECQGHSADAMKKAPVFGGLIGAALKGITYGCEERTPLVEATNAVADYLGIDHQIRDLENRGNHAAALDLCTGTGPNQSDWAFERAQKALTEAAAVNDRHFTLETDTTERILARMGWVLGLLVAGAVILQSVDLWIRTKDYR